VWRESKRGARTGHSALTGPLGNHFSQPASIISRTHATGPTPSERQGLCRPGILSVIPLLMCMSRQIPADGPGAIDPQDLVAHQSALEPTTKTPRLPSLRQRLLQMGIDLRVCCGVSGTDVCRRADRRHGS